MVRSDKIESVKKKGKSSFRSRGVTVSSLLEELTTLRAKVQGAIHLYNQLLSRLQRLEQKTGQPLNDDEQKILDAVHPHR